MSVLRRRAVAWLLVALGAASLAAQGGPSLRPYYLLAAGTTNATVVAGCRSTNLYGADLYNISVQNVYVRFYDRCATPDETHTPVLVLVIPGGLATTGDPVGHTEFRPPQPVRFTVGMSFRTTTGIAVDNTTPVIANRVVINLTYAN